VRRTLQLRVVKTNKNDTQEISDLDILSFEGRTAIISKYFERVATIIGKGVITYVVADTLRQVIIAQVNKS
jgi:hypothetical protein